MAEYIDREEFKKNVEERYCKPCKAERKDHNGCWCRACWVDDMLDEVDCFRPADVAPVVHGRWDENGYCTNCGKHAPFWPVSSCYYESPYCQNCGAKMDEEEENKK